VPHLQEQAGLEQAHGGGFRAMIYMALFIWLLACLLLGGVMHAVLGTTFRYKLVMLLAAPGTVVRKFSMTCAALASGATVTGVNVYDLGDRQVRFEANGAASVSKVLVPLAPVFTCALVLQAANVLLGSPIRLDYPPPGISSLDVGGMRGFLMGTWQLVSHLVAQLFAADWGHFRLYALLALLFSLSLGACLPFEEFREAFLGVVLLVVGLAVVCVLFGASSSFGPAPPGALASSPAAGWMESVRTFLGNTAGMAFIMMLCGVMAATLAGIVIRIVELAGRGADRTQRPGRSSRSVHRRSAA